MAMLRGFIFSLDAEVAKVVADSITKVFTPSVVFGEVEFETGAGVVGGDFAGVAYEVAEEVGKGFVLCDGSELLAPFRHVLVSKRGKLLEDGWNLCPVGDVWGGVDEVGGIKSSFHFEGEPLVFGWGWGGGDVAGEVEEAGAGGVGATVFGVGDGFAGGVGEVGVAVAAFGEEGEGVEVFFALG
jgi:hypothetical protein